MRCTIFTLWISILHSSISFTLPIATASNLDASILLAIATETFQSGQTLVVESKARAMSLASIRQKNASATG